MKILAIGDFYGKVPRGLRKIKKEEFDIVLCTGDLTDSDVLRKVEFKHWEEIRQGKDFIDILGKKQYHKIMKKSIKTMQPVIDFLSELKKPVCLIYGNSDFLRQESKKIKINALEQRVSKKKNLTLLHRRLMNIMGYRLLGFSGYRGAAPKRLTQLRGYTKKQIDEINKQWEKKLKKLFEKLKKPEKTIMFVHDTPKGKLDKVRNKASPLHGKHIGDEYFTKFIKKYQPLLCVCGHMHENPGTARIGKTLIVNPGPAFEGRYAIIELDGKIKVKLKKAR